VTATCQAPGCGRVLPARRRRFCSDLCRIRGQRGERVTETAEFSKAAVRMIRQMAKRVGGSDIAEFGAMVEVMAEAEHAVVAAIDGLRASGYSWAEIGAEIGWSKQRLAQWRQRRAEGPPAQDAGDHVPAVNDSFTAREQAQREAPRLAELSAPGRFNAAKTHCGRCGRPYSGDNLVMVKGRSGMQRRCRACHRERRRAADRLRKAAARAWQQEHREQVVAVRRERRQQRRRAAA
jgi:hypothetical protein